MTSGLLAALAVVAGAMVAAVATYFVARRQGSGKIATSEASSLWAESQAMRLELRAEVESLRGDLRDRDGQIERLQGRLDELQHRLDVLTPT